jgi:hypothetical protein
MGAVGPFVIVELPRLTVKPRDRTGERSWIVGMVYK